MLASWTIPVKLNYTEINLVSQCPGEQAGYLYIFPDSEQDFKITDSIYLRCVFLFLRELNITIKPNSNNRDE